MTDPKNNKVEKLTTKGAPKCPRCGGMGEVEIWIRNQPTGEKQICKCRIKERGIND